MPLRITYYLEVVSSWCFWAQPAWEELQQRFAGRAEFSWKLALMDATGLPVSREQCEWFYRRSGMMNRSPFMLNAGWFEPGLPEYLAPNLVAEAAKDLGVTDDRVRVAIMQAALRDGAKVGRWEVSAEIGARAGGLDAGELLVLARSAAVEERAREATREFYALGVTQRPAFVLENGIGDRAIFSGLASAAPLAATLEAMEYDEAGYLAHRAHFGGVPPE